MASNARPDRSPIRHLDRSLGHACAAWVDLVRRHAAWIAPAFLAATLLLAGYAAQQLGINSNEDDLFTEGLPSFERRAEFYRAFPLMAEPIVVVVDAETIDLADEAADALEARLARQREHFEAVRRPFGGEFFERNGLLYLTPEELDDVADHLYALQPFLAELARDASLRGIFGMLERALEAAERGDFDGEPLGEVLARIDEVARGQLDGEGEGEPGTRQLSWADVLDDRVSTPRDRRRYLLLQPAVDYEKLQPAEASLLALREAVRELGYDRSGAVRVRATGVLPLAYEEMENLGTQAAWAGLVALVLVGLILTAGLGSGRMVLASLATLVAGLVATAAFAAAAIGHLNLISVTFGVLFIGLSIDFAIHLCVRVRELATSGAAQDVVLREAARRVGSSLVLCATTTAIGFYAFVPTDFAGVAELGLIAGTGMFISLFTNLTLLPALLALFVPIERIRPLPPLPQRLHRFVAAPVRRAALVAGLAAAAGAASLALLPQVEFDTNPLRVRDPSTDSVAVFDEMLADGDAFPWNMNVLAANLEEAVALAEQIEALPTVDATRTLADLVPEAQQVKREVLVDLASVLLPSLDMQTRAPAPSAAQQRAAYAALEATLAELPSAHSLPASLTQAGTGLRTTLARLRASWRDETAAERSLARLERALNGSLAGRMRILRAALQPDRVSLETLPPELRAQLLAADGRARVEVFPAGDLADRRELERYVAEVRSVSDEAFGEALIHLETGAVIVASLQQALATAAIVIAVLLLVLWRGVADTALVALPLGLAALFTAAFSVPLRVPFNYANVIVIPLLLGMGVDSGIHLVQRLRSEKASDGNLLRTSTAAAVLLSALTTVASFGTLGFTSHRGMASLGQLLALGMALILVCNLVVLPAAAVLRQRWGAR